MITSFRKDEIIDNLNIFYKSEDKSINVIDVSYSLNRDIFRVEISKVENGATHKHIELWTCEAINKI